ncbi:MAG TPA: VOC family protein [Feifaniaceae bacterium]|nr:VOC family protein [Feifaniaceae bacterium]
MEQAKIPAIELYEVVLDCRNVALLCDFYSRLLGWENTYREDEWTAISSPSGGVKIAFQENELYVPPVWPETPERQQQMEHLDFMVNGPEEMELAVAHAISCGAKKADIQYSDQWTVLFDPEGHPFCIVI